MLTVVALLLLPFVFGMSVFRAYQLPQVLLARTARLNPRHPLVAGVALGTVYVALVVYTLFVLYTVVGTALSAPNSVQELFSVAATGVGYPFVYLAFEWVRFYSVRSGPGC